MNWYHGNPGKEAHEQIALEYRQRLADIDLNSFGANEEHRRYYYVVDDEGAMWVCRPDDLPAGIAANLKHSSLIEIGRCVFCAGEMKIYRDGRVSANCSSGHYMMEDPLLGDEPAIWRRAIAETISEAKFTPDKERLFPENRAHL